MEQPVIMFIFIISFTLALYIDKNIKANPHKNMEDVIQENKIIIILTISMLVGIIYMNQDDQMIKTSFGKDVLMTEDFYSPE
tara:strand:- start:512 stop:757 length:246 start_codon:yes stop_codon:yes gene_type:complete